MISLGPVVQARLPKQPNLFFGLKYSANEGEAADYGTAFGVGQTFLAIILPGACSPTLWA
jgi:hypothetical protein